MICLPDRFFLFQNLTKILYTDPELMNLCDKEYNPGELTFFPITAV